MNAKSLHSCSEAGETLGLTKQEVARLIRLGRIRATMVAGRWLITAREIAGFRRRPVGRPAGRVAKVQCG